MNTSVHLGYVHLRLIFYNRNRSAARDAAERKPMDITDGFRKFALAAIGAGAITYEKTSEIVGDLVKKGEITVEQGKAMNQELKHNVKESVNRQKQEFRDAAERAKSAAAGKSADAAEQSTEDESRTVDSTATEVINDAADKAKEIIDIVSKLSADQVEAVKKAIDSLGEVKNGTEQTAGDENGTADGKKDSPKDESEESDGN